MSDNPLSSSTGILAVEQKLQGRSNFPGWKKDFTLLAQSKGYMGYYNGSITLPTADPTHNVTTTTTDPSGGVTTVIVSTPIKSTSPGCEKPLIHEWGTRNGGANLTLKNCIDDPDSVGFKEEDSAQVNWNRIIVLLGKQDSVEQLVAEEKFSRQIAQFTFEHDDEYKDFMQVFIALRKGATQAGVLISDANAKNRLISIVSSNDILRAAAFGLPTNATFAETNAKLASTHFFQWNEVRKQQAEAIKIQAMVAQALSAQASLQAQSSSSGKKKEKREKNLASDICRNRFHGLSGGKGHKTENCWEEGGANIAGKPPHWKSRPSKAHEFDTPEANSISAPTPTPSVPAGVGAASISIGVPEVFAFSTSLGDRLSDGVYSSLSERLNIPSLEDSDNDEQVPLLRRLGG
ncbi:hypothetical protein C8J56DRAFT_1101874 [Mycena floridula]|nr:hypothetical protein C8J56DRAFT_1101874 [Mycena floridula]